ncbi:MAG: MerC domain-containing protein [Bacteroidota bacterium]
MRAIYNYLDILGFSASFLCAVHCVLMPLLLTLGLASGLEWLEEPLIEWSFILTTVILASWSLVGTWSRHHDKRPLLIAGVGFAIIIGVHLLPGHVNHYIAGLGGLLIAYAHYRNWRLLHRTSSSHATQQQHLPAQRHAA